MHRFGPPRVFALLFALVQLVLPPLATVADARQERTSGVVAVPHAEGERSESCTAAHPAHCAVCQFLTACGAAASAGTPIAQAAASANVGARYERPDAATERGAARPRAPPVA